MNGSCASPQRGSFSVERTVPVVSSATHSRFFDFPGRAARIDGEGLAEEEEEAPAVGEVLAVEGKKHAPSGAFRSFEPIWTASSASRASGASAALALRTRSSSARWVVETRSANELWRLKHNHIFILY